MNVVVLDSSRPKTLGEPDYLHLLENIIWVKKSIIGVNMLKKTEEVTHSDVKLSELYYD